MRVALAIVIAGCNSAAAITGDATPADVYEPVDATAVVDSLAFSPPAASITWPDTLKLQVFAHYTDDAVLDVTEYVTYGSEQPDIAIAPGGTVLSRGPGVATITASYMGAIATMAVTVAVPTLAVASPDGVDFFPASAQGTPTPERSIRGAATTLQHACGLAVLGSELFVADSTADAIDVFPLAGSGNIAPTRRITTSFTPVSIAATGTSIYVGASDGVRVFVATASGAATPTQTISGAQTTIVNGAGIAVYQAQLYVVTQGGSVAAFPIAANGNVAPTRVISGANTGLGSSSGIAVAFDLELVTDAVALGTVQIFFPSQNGNVVPEQQIAGDQTLLVTPTSIVNADSMVFVGTPSSSSIEVFPSTTNGEFPPTQTIGGVNVQAMALF